MAIAMACHVEPVAGSGAAFVATNCQGVVESRSTHRREWSRIMAVDTACQRVMGLRRVHRREWSRIMAVNTAWEYRSEARQWSELMAESGSRKSLDEVCLQPLESRTKPGSRRSPGGVFLQLKLKAKSGSRRSPDGAYR